MIHGLWVSGVGSWRVGDGPWSVSGVMGTLVPVNRLTGIIQWTEALGQGAKRESNKTIAVFRGILYQ